MSAGSRARAAASRVLAEAERGGHDAHGAGREPDPPGDLQALEHAIAVLRRGVVVDLRPAARLGDPAGDGRAGDHPGAGHPAEPVHVRPVAAEPARHRERLRRGRVEPRLDEVRRRVARRDVGVRHLDPGEGVDLVLELGRQRRVDVEVQPAADRVAADPAAQQQAARPDRAGGDDDRLRRKGHAGAAAVAAGDARGAAAAALDPLDGEVREHVEPAGLLRAREQHVERGVARGEPAADVAVAGPAAGVRDVRLHQLDAARQVHPRHRVREPARRGAGPVGADRLDAEVGADVRDRRAQPAGVDPGRGPGVEHGGGRVEAEAVVDRRAAADAHPLQHLEAEVRRELERALVVELEVLLHLVVGERGRVDVRSALEHEHAPAGGREPGGEDRAGGARADHDHVVARGRRLRQRRQARRHRRGRGRGARAPQVGRVADRRPGAAVAVVAEVGHLRGGPHGGLEQRPQRARQAPARRGVDEAPLEERAPRGVIERGQRWAEREQRPGGDGQQRELDAALGARVEVGEVAVDVAGDVGGGEQLAVALDRDVGERLERGEAGGVQVAQPVAGARRRDPPGEEPGRQDDVDRHPGEQRDGGGDVDPEHVDVGRAAPDQRGDLARDERDVGERDQQREPAAPPHVGGAERRRARRTARPSRTSWAARRARRCPRSTRYRHASTALRIAWPARRSRRRRSGGCSMASRPTLSAPGGGPQPHLGVGGVTRRERAALRVARDRDRAAAAGVEQARPDRRHAGRVGRHRPHVRAAAPEDQRLRLASSRA